MALKSIGILITLLCATLTIALDHEVRYLPEQRQYYGPNDVYYHAQIEPSSYDNAASKKHYGLNSHYSYNSEQSGERVHHGYPKPDIPHNFYGSGEHHGFSNLHFPHSPLDSGASNYHGQHKQHSPHSSVGSGELGHPNFFKPQLGEWKHNSFLKPQFPYSFESGKWVHHGNPKPNNPQNSEGLGWHHSLPNSHFPHSSLESGASNYHDLHKPNSRHSSEESGEHHGLLKPQFLRSSEGSEEPEHSEIFKPHNPQNAEQSSQWNHNSFLKPQFPYSSESGEWVHHGHLKPNIPHNSEGFGEHHSIPNPHFPYSFLTGSEVHHGLHKPHFSHNSQDSGNHHSLLKPHFSHSSQEQNSRHKITRPDWYNPHFPQHSEQLKEHSEEMERRRPLFYPIYPYHFYPYGHPYGQPSIDDAEFETIEAIKGITSHESQGRRNFIPENKNVRENSEQRKYQGPYHGSHNPHFSLNHDNSDEDSMEKPFRPFHHGFPHFNPFAPNVVEDPYINGDDFSTSDEDFLGPFITIEHGEGNFQIPGFIFDILEHLHHGHEKPNHHGDHKPIDEDEADEEGSGEGDIIPLSAEVKIPLIQDEDILEDEN